MKPSKQTKNMTLTEKMTRMFESTFTREEIIVTIIVLIILVYSCSAIISQRATTVQSTQSLSVSDWVAEQEIILQGFAKAIENSPEILEDGELIEDYLEAYTEGFEYISMSYVLSYSFERPIYTNTKWVCSDSFDLSVKSYFSGALETDGVYMTDVYVDEVTGAPCLTISMKLDVDSCEAVVALDFYLDELVALMEESYTGNQYASLVVNNVIITDPNASYSLSLDTSVDISDTVYAKLGSSPSLILYNGLSLGQKTAIEGTNWYVISIYNITSTVIYILIGLAAFALILAVAVIGEKKRVRRTVDGSLAPLSSLGDQLHEFAEGRLDIDFNVQTDILDLIELQENLTHMQQSLSGYVSDITSILGQLADNNYTVTSNVDYRNSFAPIRSSMDQIVGHLGKSFCVFHHSISEAESVSSDVSSALADLNITVAELTGSMREITERTEGSVEILTQNSTDLARVAEESLDQLLAQIQNIKQSSNNISSILDTVNTIAKQTNLLSLNASIEAARAGEAGRGFAVVADEIRQLSFETTEANKEIEELIEQNNIIVKNAITTAEEMQSALVDVIADNNRSVEDLNKISEILVSQDSTFGQLRGTTAQNAASTQELSGKTIELRNEIEKFHF